MNLFLDDIRNAPQGWQIVRTVDECIDIIKQGDVEKLSLDHDLGATDSNNCGYDVILFLERIAFCGNLDIIPSNIVVHSSNVSAKIKMIKGIEAIDRLKGQRRND